MRARVALDPVVPLTLTVSARTTSLPSCSSARAARPVSTRFGQPSGRPASSRVAR